MFSGLIALAFIYYLVRRIREEEAGSFTKLKQYFGLRSKCCNAKIVTNYLAPDKTLKTTRYCTSCKKELIK